MKDRHIIAVAVGGAIATLLIAVIIIVAPADDSKPSVENAPQAAPSTRPTPDPVPTPAFFGKDVELKIDTTYAPETQYVVTGTTNLPAGTHLLIEMSRDRPPSEFMDDQIDVQADGRFQSRPLGPERGLEPDDYTIRVIMLPPERQPEFVKSTIGARGENLRGRLAHSLKNGSYVRADLALHLAGDGRIPRTNSLFIAAGRGDEETAIELIRRGANLAAHWKESGIDRGTALHVAARFNKPSMVRLLIAHGAKVDERESNDGETALHLAAVGGLIEVAKALLENGASVSICNISDETPLLRCICNGKLEMVKLLVEHGARLDVTDCDGETPLSEAERFHFIDLASWIRERTTRHQ